MLLMSTVVGDLKGLLPSSFCNDSIMFGLVARTLAFRGVGDADGRAGWKPAYCERIGVEGFKGTGLGA
jgi:hypothetical protein